MKSPYGICEDHRETLEEKIIAHLSADDVAGAIKKKLSDFCQEAVDKTTEYLTGEYQLVIEDIAKDRANRMVQELLKGNHEVAKYFHIEGRTGYDGKPFVYDVDGVRRAIFDTFKAEIENAELLNLAEENERLRESMKIMQRSRY